MQASYFFDANHKMKSPLRYREISSSEGRICLGIENYTDGCLGSYKDRQISNVNGSSFIEQAKKAILPASDVVE
ncbi:hypothetical protein GCM10022414_15240 [Zhongshania borealis]|uniref:Uncharacterized protein n=1 Tax=Zhongshania borealis TaxID=889488 RepID=A0ABP7WNI7_9GAMM